MFDPDRIVVQNLDIFIECDNWLTCRQFAYPVTGNPSSEHVIRRGRVFVVNDGCRCKLRAELTSELLPGLRLHLNVLSNQLSEGRDYTNCRYAIGWGSHLATLNWSARVAPKDADATMRE